MGEVSSETSKPPPASFSSLVLMLGAGALQYLGVSPDPIEKRPVVNLTLAKHTIDTLEILHRKTKGNLEAEEARLLSDLLHELRLKYLRVQSREGGIR